MIEKKVADYSHYILYSNLVNRENGKSSGGQYEPKSTLFMFRLYLSQTCKNILYTIVVQRASNLGYKLQGVICVWTHYE